MKRDREESSETHRQRKLARKLVETYSVPLRDESCTKYIPLSKWRECDTNKNNCCVKTLGVTAHYLRKERDMFSQECVEQVLSLLAACISYAYLYDKDAFQYFSTQFDFATSLLSAEKVLNSYLQQNVKDTHVYHFFNASMHFHKRKRYSSNWNKFGEILQKIVGNAKDEFGEICNTYLTKYLQLRQITLDTTIRVKNHFEVLIEYIERANPFHDFDILLTAHQPITEEFVGCVCFRFPKIYFHGYEMKHILGCPFYSNSLKNKEMNIPSNIVLSASDSLVLYVIDLMKKESLKSGSDNLETLNVYPLRENIKWLKRLSEYQKMYPAISLTVNSS